MADLETSILIKILDSFTAPLRKLTDGLGVVEDAGDKAKKKLALAADLNQAAEAAGRFGNMLIGPVKGAVKEFADFDHALSKLSAMGGGERGSAVFEAMKQQAMDLGAATQYSGQEVAELQTSFLKAGFTSAQTMSVVEQTMSAASAEGIGLAQTATIVAGALNGMRLGVSEAARVTDVLAVASVKSDADMQGLSDALAYVGDRAASTGTSLELTTAMLGKLNDAQIKGGQAGTVLRSVMSRLIKPTEEAGKWFAKLGFDGRGVIELQKAVASGHIDQALARIGEAANKLPDHKRLQALAEIFGDEASAGAGILINASMNTDMSEGSKGLGALVVALQRAEGESKRMAATMQDDLAGSLERAGGALSGLNTSIGEALAPRAKDAAEMVEGLAGAMSSWVKIHPEATSATMELVSWLGAISLGTRGILLAASAYQSLKAAVIAARVAADWNKASTYALVAAAGAAGYAIGTYINRIFELDDKLSALFGRPRGVERAKERGLGNDPVQTLAGGWKVNRVTGEIVEQGKGPMPKSVREKMARGAEVGASTVEEVNAVMRGDRDARNAAFRAGGGMLAGASDQAFLAPGALGATDAAAQATREQTAQLLETLRKQQAAAEATKAATEALNRRLGAGPGGVPLVYG